MHIKVSEELVTGDLVCIKVDTTDNQQIARWTLGQEAIGVTTRPIKAGEAVEYIHDQSTADILVRGSHSPMSGQNIVIQMACDLKADELVCIRQTGGQAMLDRWGFGDEAVGLAARDIKADEFVKYCAGSSTEDIQVKPGS